ncbi:helix-turn-helix domain-containing protein [Mycobacteroides abscessus]|uniref:helix-turn-helix domain-containing protein n=1 Tax=Mycobacteroides abscessus TaxID=36809 RepID=UPI000C25FF63|nr:helix-turn-helix domain-containing protein [Mycobacteroides abscessus]
MDSVNVRLSEIGARIRAARENAGQTQAAAATAMGMRRPDLSVIENGQQNITMTTLYRIADHYNITANSLIPD